MSHEKYWPHTPDEEKKWKKEEREKKERRVAVEKENRKKGEVEKEREREQIIKELIEACIINRDIVGAFTIAEKEGRKLTNEELKNLMREIYGSVEMK